MELVDKYERINELARMGFNTPRCTLITPSQTAQEQFEKLHEVSRMAQGDGRSFINVRTYGRQGAVETWNSTHHTFVPIENADSLLEQSIKKGLYCMPDAEDPNNGEYAGCVQVRKDGTYTVDWCHNPNGGAMVRMTTDTFNGAIHHPKSRSSLPFQVWKAAEIAFEQFDNKYTSVILEWSRVKKDAGRLRRAYIWWEYRDLVL